MDFCLSFKYWNFGHGREVGCIHNIPIVIDHGHPLVAAIREPIVMNITSTMIIGIVLQHTITICDERFFVESRYQA